MVPRYFTYAWPYVLAVWYDWRTFRPVPPKNRKPHRDLPDRLSVPVSDDDAARLRRIQATTHLGMSALTRLLLHRGIHAYLADGKLDD